MQPERQDRAASNIENWGIHGGVIVASCRAPVAPVRRRGKLAWESGTGGLVRVLEPALGAEDRWVAAAEPGVALPQDLRREPPTPYDIRYVPLDRKSWRLFTAACNRVLWLALHGMAVSPSLRITDILAMWESGYRTASRAFANVLAAEWERRPVPILLQDYHLFGCAAELRSRVPHAEIALFCHTPFPEAAGLSALPQFVTLDVLDGLRSADLVGFQTGPDIARFRRTAAMFQRRGVADPGAGFRPALQVFPAAVDAERVLSEAVPAGGGPYGFWDKDVRVITWAGRSDPAKNPVGALEAFRHLLERRPLLRGKVRLLMKVQPSRQSLPEYRLCLLEVQKKAAEMNSIYASGQWVPVVLDLSPERANLTAALSSADVLLVNSLADGMNLVVQEAVLLSQRVVVVLSRSAGAYERLGEGAIGVNPRDPIGVARALEQALSLPTEEREWRLDTLRKEVLQSNPRRWLRSQVEALHSTSRGRYRARTATATGASQGPSRSAAGIVRPKVAST